MIDSEFNNLQAALCGLSIAGAFTVIFPLAKEKDIRDAMFKRYGKRPDNKVVLSNIEIIFI